MVKLRYVQGPVATPQSGGLNNTVRTVRALYETDAEIAAHAREIYIQAADIALQYTPVLAGTAARAIAAAAARPFDLGPLEATVDIGVYARLGAAKGPGGKPKPLYLRPADAKPQAGFVLPRA